MLLNALIKDEQINNKKLYSSGSYWSYKNKKTIIELKKKGLENFRGLNSGVGSSFADNLVSDVRNELNFRGRLVGKLFSLPFLNKIFKYQVKITENYIEKFIKNLSINYKTNKEVIKLIEKYKFNNTTNFGCIRKFSYQNKEYSTLYLEMAHRIDTLSTKYNFKNIRSFFEIGGGFGANVHFLISNFPNIKKIIYLDAVPNIYVGTEYLRSHFKQNVKDYLDLRDLDKISFSDNNELEIICIPPWLIEKLNLKVDHFHNAASFVEMPEFVVKNYIKFIEKFKTREISLISYDNYDTNTTFNPSKLKSFFDTELKVSWKDGLIKDYEKKLIYITSN